MLWIKRNLFLVAFGLVAAVLLGWGGFYLYSRIQRNAEVEKELDDKKAQLDHLYKLDPFPSATNIAIARTNQQQLRATIAQAQKYFTPIPYEKVTGLEFKKLLDTTIFELQNKARQSSVTLPSKEYAFAFEAQKSKTQFAPGSFPVLPEQLADIKTICSLLCDAKVNKLVNVKRSRVTADDNVALPDYHELKRQTNQELGMVLSPYEITFMSFSSELATVLENTCKSPHGLIVKAIVVDAAGPALAEPGVLPATAVPAPTPAVAGANPPRPAFPASVQRPPVTQAVPPRPGAPPLPRPGTPVPPVRQPPTFRPQVPGPAVPAAAKDVLQTVLNEKLLKITLLVEVIKPAK